jgi:hypothetical protein
MQSVEICTLPVRPAAARRRILLGEFDSGTDRLTAVAGAIASSP